MRRYTAKEALLERADAVSLHLVLSDRTRGHAGCGGTRADEAGAVLINTSRGPLVDEAALLAALHAGRIVAALECSTASRCRWTIRCAPRRTPC